MIQEAASVVRERGEAISEGSLGGPRVPAGQQPRTQTSRLALAALGLGTGTFLALVLTGFDGWLMSQGVLDTHDLPVVGTWVLPVPTLLTVVLTFLAKRRIVASGGALTGRGLVRGSFWLAGIDAVVLLGFAGLLLSSAGETYMCGGG